MSGRWTYRGFVNDPNLATPFNGLRFAVAELIIEAFALRHFTGRFVFGPDAVMALTGASSFGNPFIMRLQGRGESPGIEDFVYAQVGYLVPA